MSQKGNPLKSPSKSLHRPRILKEKKQHSVEEVQQLLDNAVSSNPQSLPSIVRQIFEECQAEEDEPCRKIMFEFCILNGQRVTSQVIKEVLGKLLHEVDSLKGSSLIEVADLIIKGIKEGSHHALELFPKVLSVISSQKKILYRKEGGSSGEIEGMIQKSHLLNSLCGCRWEPSCVLHIADMCKDISMTSEELEFLIQKILRVMKTLNLSELPPLVYQLLVLSNKGHKALVLQGIQALFNELDHEMLKSKEQHTDGVVAISGGEKELLQTEGTVILHISFALKQGQELRKEYLKLLESTQAKLSSSVLSPFSVALSLSVARIHRFENDVFKFLKEVVIRSFKDEERRKASKWIQEVCDDVPDMERLLMEIVEHSACGWDHVLQGLVMLGFNLMELYAPKSQCPTFGSSQYKACCLGSRLLLKTFKLHRIVQEEVLSQLINRILTNAAGYVIHYIGLLGSIISSCPHIAMEFPPQLKEVFAYLSLLPSSAAVELLHTVLPVIQYSAAVRDSLIIILRKSLFMRQVESRRIAVGGYLLLLKKFTVLDSLSSNDSQSSQVTHSSCSSQVTVEVHGGPSSNRALCLEILGTLRRSLTNQSDVRQSLYEGLYPVFSANASLAEPIIDILVGHLKMYYEDEEDVIPPVKFNLCLSSSGSDVIQVEPLDAMVRCLQLCVTKYSEWEEESNEEREIPSVIEEAQDILQSLIERMGKSDPEDFELDKSSDFTATTSVGQKNKTVAKMMMGVYESLLEYTFTDGEFSQKSCDQTIKLYQAYHKMSTIWQDKGSHGGAGTSKKGPSGAVPSWSDGSNLSLNCVIRFLTALFSDSLPGHQQPLSVLRDSSNFVKYIITAALGKVHQLCERGRCDGASINHETEMVFKQCCDLGKMLFKQIETSGPGPTKKDKGKSNPALCLEGFHQLLLTMVTWFNNPVSCESGQQVILASLHDFLVHVNPALRDKEPDEGIHHFIKFFESVIVDGLSGQSSEWSTRDLQLMINTICSLSNELDSDSLQLKETFEWAYMQCKNQNTDDGPLTKALVSLMLTLNARYKGSVKTVGKLAKDVHYHLGDIDDEVELEGEAGFAIVNPRTTTIILNLIFTHIDSILGDADWLINRLRSEISSSPSEDIFEGQRSPVGTQATDYCTTVCDRLIYIVSACNELVQTSLSPGPTTDGMFKVVTKLFTTLGNLTKYNLTLYPQTCTVLPSFGKLVSIVGKDLCQQVYASIFFVQQSIQASNTGGNDQSKKGKKGTKRTSSGGKVSVRRDARSVPNLIYAIEQLEKFLIKLDKKAKVNLMESFKRSTARDFRINTQLINDTVEDDQEEDDSQQENEAPPKAKRKKN